MVAQLFFGGEVLSEGVSSVSALALLPCTAQRTSCIHLTLAVFLLTLFLLLLHLLSFVQDFSDCSWFALRTYPSKRVQGPTFRSPRNIRLRFTLLAFLSSFLGKHPWTVHSLGQQHFSCFLP